jgi:anthranilate synthase component 1/para-aminobenzoate synthetase component 1
LSFKKVVPVWRSFPIKRFTPVDIYEKVRGKNSFLLESAGGTDRYSFIGFGPYLIFKSKGREIRIKERGKGYFEKGNPIRRLKELIDRFRMIETDNLPPFSGGAVGYLNYEARHFFETLPRNAPDDLKIPDIYFVFTDKVIAFDHFEEKIFVICCARPGGYSLSAAEKELRHLEEKIFSEGEKRFKERDASLFLGPEIKSNFTRAEFMSMVRHAKEYIKCGDIYQANLSQRLSTSIKGDSLNLYKILRQINPSPFASFLDFDEVKIVSSSPERLLFVKGELVETRPIAGTRPRGRNISEDKKFSRRLILSPKERAEHIMLVDLERNDLGRVCRYGTVEVDELMTLENYSHVIHIVSNIRGKLKPGMDRFSAIASCFPGGTITGTPKIRSMEIIDKLEKVARSIYTGSIGYLNYGGEMDLNIVIRTFVIADGSAHIQVGAGIVADSDPEREYYETLHKAEALVTAIRKVNSVRKNEALCAN